MAADGDLTPEERQRAQSTLRRIFDDRRSEIVMERGNRGDWRVVIGNGRLQERRKEVLMRLDFEINDIRAEVRRDAQKDPYPVIVAYIGDRRGSDE